MSRPVVIALAIGAGLACAEPASAQGLFDFLFGRRPPPQAQPYADPFGFQNSGEVERRAESSVPASTYCVRLCDGHYFPVQKQRGASMAETCSAFCPAAKTKIFSGSGIDYAVASDGKNYSGLENAYAYRSKLVDSCTCNGKDAFGLARMKIEDDPTLRPGDFVATKDGMMTYRGERRGVAQFAPADRGAVSSGMRQRLSQMKVHPEFDGEASTAAETSGVAPTDERRSRQTQSSR